MTITSNAGIYKYTNKNNGKVYIGQAQHIDQRYKQHLGNKVEKGIDGAIYNEGIEAFDFEVLVSYPELPGEVLDYLEAHFIDKYDSYNKGYNLTRGNHPERLAEEAARTAHMVTFDECKAIINTFNLTLPEGKNVLFIGQFAMAENFAYKNNVTVISDSVFYNCGGATIIRAYNLEIVEELKKMNNKHFDLIIANPPYGNVGNKITKNIIDTFTYDNYINCQPQSSYVDNGNGNGCYKYVDTDNVLHFNKFAGAKRGTEVVQILKTPRYDMTEENFRLKCFDTWTHKFLFDNIHRTANYTQGTVGLNVETSGYLKCNTINTTTNMFAVPDIAPTDGVHSSGADVEFNLNKKHAEGVLNYYSKKHTDWIYSYFPVEFTTAVELDNFVNWWYGSKFMDRLLKGSHLNHFNSPARVAYVIPKVDWTHPWTDEEILKDYGYTEKEIEEILK